MSNRQFFIPISLQTELERLATAAGVDFNISDDSGESEYLYFMDQLTTKVETSNNNIENLKSKLRQKEATSDRNNYQSNLSAKEQKLLKQTEAFEQEIHGDIEKADEGLGYAEKINRLHNKYQKEKDQRKVLESFIQAQNKKIKVLVDHVEKLMKAIKIESNKRIHLIEENRRMVNDQGAIQLRADKQQKINSLQHRTIQELREGSKVLEDQLRLMDEKYLELKSKYDLAREQFNRKYKKMSKDNDDMRIYIRMNGGNRPNFSATQRSSPPSSPNMERMQITIPAATTSGNYHSNNGTPYANSSKNISGSYEGGIAAGSGMNHALSRKAANASVTYSSTPALIESAHTKGKSINESPAIPTSMSASFLLGMGGKQFSSPVQDAANMVQVLNKSGALDYTGSGDPNDSRFRPVSASSPAARDNNYDYYKNRPHTASGTSSHNKKKENAKVLNHVLDKITRHNGKKSVWSAERLSSLLED